MKYLKSDLNAVSGFTLLEVLIAMAILVLSLASILSVESGSIRATDRAKQINVVSMLAKNTMVEAEFKIQGKKFEEIPAEEAGKFEAPYQDYSWKVSIKELKFPSLGNLGGGGGSASGSGSSSSSSSSSTGSSTGGLANQSTEMITRVITNYLSKSLREVTVTILYGDSGPKKQEFTVSTYWVDLNRAVSLSE